MPTHRELPLPDWQQPSPLPPLARRSTGRRWRLVLAFVSGLIGLACVSGTLKVAPQATTAPSLIEVPQSTTVATPGSPTPLPASVVQQKEAARSVDPREVVADPQAFNGVNMTLRGRAVNVDQKTDYTWVNLSAVVPNRISTEGLVVEIRPKDTHVLSDECYQVWGVGGGAEDVTQVFTGAGRTVPLVRAYAWQLIPTSGPVASCAAPAPATATAVPVPSSTPRPTATASLRIAAVTATPQAEATQPGQPSPASFPIVPGQVVWPVGAGGTMKLTVEGSNLGKALPLQPPVTAAGNFLVVVATVQNIDSRAAPFVSGGASVGSPLRIRDGQGRVFDPASAAVQAAVQHLYGRRTLTEPIAPGGSIPVAIAFDVAPDSTAFLLQAGTRP